MTFISWTAHPPERESWRGSAAESASGGATVADQGHKDDGGKVRLELIPPEVPFAIGEVLTKGAAKYADRNWENGISYGRVFGAAMRHLWAWWGGRQPTSSNFAFGDLDPEWEFSHLWHALCCVSFLVAFESRPHIADEFDDRPSI